MMRTYGGKAGQASQRSQRRTVVPTKRFRTDKSSFNLSHNLLCSPMTHWWCHNSASTSSRETRSA